MKRTRRSVASLGGRLVLGVAVVTVGGIAALLGAGEGDPPEPGADALSTVVNATMGLTRSEIVRLDVGREHVGRPLRLALEFGGRTRTLDMHLHSVRAEDYRVFHSDAAGTLREVEPGPVTTLRGVVEEDPGSLVAGGVMEDGFYARIIDADGTEHWIEPIERHFGPAVAGLHVVYQRQDVVPGVGVCGSDDVALAPPVKPLVGGQPGVEPASGGNIYVAELGVDCDRFYFNRWGGGTETRVNQVINQMNVQYLRDVDIRHDIAAIIIREQQVYTSNSPFTLLSQFRSRWINFHGNIVRDVAHLFTGRNLDGNVIGIAWNIPGPICSTSGAYCLSQSDFNNIFQCATDLSAHELGHLWGAFHCNCQGWTMNPSITCANRFIQGSINSIVNHRNSRNCLDVEGGQEPPANDDCANAIAINEGSFNFDTTLATTDGPDLPPQCEEGFGLSLVQDIWYRYFPTCTGVATIDLCKSNYDTRIAVYTGDGGCPGAIIDCNDDACGGQGLQSRLVIPVEESEDVIIRVGGFDSGGPGTMEVSCEPGQEPVPADPESFEVTRGAFASGDLDDLLSSDNQYLRIDAIRYSKIGAASVELEVTGTAVTDTPSEIALTVEAASEGFPVRRVTQMYNYVTGSFETVDERPGNTSDASVTIDITTNADRFVEPGTREVRARIGYLDLGVTFVSWQGRFDEIFWLVTP